MANGKPGDHPITDICTYGLPVFSPRADALIRDIHRLTSADQMRSLLDWFHPPPLAEFEGQLQILRDHLRDEARERGWEADP
jgi:hypothetical protein